MGYLLTGKRLKADTKLISIKEFKSPSSPATGRQEDFEEEPKASVTTSVDDNKRKKPTGISSRPLNLDISLDKGHLVRQS